MPIYPGRRAGTWRVTVYAEKRQHEWIVEGTKGDARRIEARERLALAARSVTQGRAVPTFSAFCAEHYRPLAERQLGVRTWKVRIYQLATLVEHFGASRIDRISTEMVESYKAARQAAGLRASTLNHELQVLKTILRWSKRLVGAAPVDLEVKLLGRGPRARVLAWTEAEVERLYRAARALYPRLVPMIAFMLNTGARKGEAIAAEWSWIDWRAKMLRIPVTDAWHPKDKDAREVPLPGSLLAELRALERSPSGRLFPSRWGTPRQKFPNTAFAEIVARAKLRGSPHTTRHTFASHFLRSVPDLPLLAAVLGHSHTRVTELYAHMLPGHLERARGAVDLGPQKLWRGTLAPVVRLRNRG